MVADGEDADGVAGLHGVGAERATTSLLLAPGGRGRWCQCVEALGSLRERRMVPPRGGLEVLGSR